MAEHVIKKMGSRMYFECPGCGTVAGIDGDQYHGRVSIQCTECDFHETINLAEEDDG